MTGKLTLVDAADYETGVNQDERLELRLWLRLLTCSNLIEATVRRNLRERFATTLPRFDILAQLDRVPQGLSLGALSKRMMVSNGNVTGLIERLAAEGLVEAKTPSSDRRRQIVRLTPAGKAAFDAMTPEHEDWIADLMAELDRRDMIALYDGLAKLKDSLVAAQANGGETEE